jgi:hypothetical protein
MPLNYRGHQFTACVGCTLKYHLFPLFGSVFRDIIAPVTIFFSNLSDQCLNSTICEPLLSDICCHTGSLSYHI